jgi:RNA polymerase sigma factor (sigma-70 family)
MSADVLLSPAAEMDDPLFLEEVRRQMLQFAVQQLGDSSLAEDVVQDALVGALRNQKSFKGRAALRSWMFAILKNKIVDSIRRKSRVSAHEEQIMRDEIDRAGPFDSRGRWRPESKATALGATR